MTTVRNLAELEAIYGEAVASSRTKEVDHLTPLHARYIEASPFVVVATSGPEGMDCSPRGDPAGFVSIIDPRTLHIPDRRGNNRVDTLRNLVVDPRIGLLFMIPGIGVTLRVNGTAELSADVELRERYTLHDKVPATVIVVAIETVFTQCPKALVRSHLWDPAGFRDPSELPTVGQINEAITNGAFDGKAYDDAYPERLRTTLY